MSAEYHIQSIRSALVREMLGGVSAVDSHLFDRAAQGLMKLGWTGDQIIDAYKEQLSSLVNGG